MRHPLINPRQKHYSQDGKSAIKELEQLLTVDQMIGFCKASIFKYEFRKDLKGQKDSDLVKIETYKNYLKVLETCSYSARSVKLVNEYFLDAKLEFEYE